ncbi:MAG: OsmC family protein [Actinomycetota bacterium]
MSNDSIRTAIQGAVEYLTDHPGDARATDSFATATIEEGLRCVVSGPDGAETHTDMVTAVGGANSAPSPGWLLRAATASCVATLIAMKAAIEGLSLGAIEVTVDSESNDLGILGIDDEVPAAPSSVSVRVKLETTDGDAAKVEEIIRWADEHCPVTDLTRREVPVTLETEIT